MFETLSEKLNAVFKRLGNKGRLTEKDVDEALREVRPLPYPPRTADTNADTNRLRRNASSLHDRQRSQVPARQHSGH